MFAGDPRLTRAAHVLCLALALLVVARCNKPSDPHVLTVHVKQDGTMLMNGKPTTLEQLKQEFARLAKEGGTVRYSRDNPAGAPPPNAMAVIQAIVEAKVSVQLAESGP